MCDFAWCLCDAMYFVVCSKEAFCMGPALEDVADMQRQVLDVILTSLDVQLQQAEEVAASGSSGSSRGSSGSTAEVWWRLFRALEVARMPQLDQATAHMAGQRGAAMRVLGPAVRVLRLMSAGRAEALDDVCIEPACKLIILSVQGALDRMLDSPNSAGAGEQEELWDAVVQVLPHIVERVRLRIGVNDSSTACAHRMGARLCTTLHIVLKSAAYAGISSAGQAVRWCYAGEC